MNIYQLQYDDYTYHVIAPTRGKARVEFIAWFGFEPEFISPMSIRILEKEVDMPAGVDEQWTWARKNRQSIHFYDCLSDMPDIACQECGHLLWDAESGGKYCPECLEMQP